MTSTGSQYKMSYEVSETEVGLVAFKPSNLPAALYLYLPLLYSFVALMYLF